MSTSSLPSVDIDRALVIWADYCSKNDVSRLKDKTAGIEPISGRVWFGESATDVHEKMVADGVDRPAYFVRVGYDYYLRKGGRR